MMSNKAVNFMIFTLGATIGSVTTWKYIKKKYEQIAQEEINSVKEVFSKRDLDVVKENDEVRVKADMAKEKPHITEYTNQLYDQGYATNYSDISFENRGEEVEPIMTERPYVISPEEFSELDEYDKIGLTYYADKVLTDDDDYLIDDIEDVVGYEALDSFGLYEDDAVCVRNDRLKCAYEILIDQRNYSDVVEKRPHEVD